LGDPGANLLLARPISIKAAEPWYLVSNLNPTLDLVWAYGQRFCCEQLFRDQKSGIFQLERSGLRDPERIDRLLLVVAITVLLSSLQGYAVSLSGQRRRVDPHWKRGLSFARIGLHWLQRSVITASRALLAWLPIPLQTLEPCIPSRGVRRRQRQAAARLHACALLGGRFQLDPSPANASRYRAVLALMAEAGDDA
jgi:hypothetical protein